MTRSKIDPMRPPPRFLEKIRTVCQSDEIACDSAPRREEAKGICAPHSALADRLPRCSWSAGARASPSGSPSSRSSRSSAGRAANSASRSRSTWWSRPSRPTSPGRLADRLSPRALLDRRGTALGGTRHRASSASISQPWHALAALRRRVRDRQRRGRARSSSASIVMRAYPGRAGLANAVAISGHERRAAADDRAPRRP